ncbi:Outer membrane protein OmpA [Collimonas sp. OK307]|uniref:OmpA family protein n=1 Tax=Collimonas sp. OK307 TaxID=1801620 RepID=UPI0008F44389|nr:OmpA family protein [Collimonas sp. OK307]SFI16246.1 Outer membrane protein OmpA [Collimonas sp. OK307]
MDNNDSEQKAALGIVWAIVGAVVVAVLLLASYIGITAGKGGNTAAGTVSASAAGAGQVAAAAAPAAASADTSTAAVPAVVKIFFETGKSEAPASAATDVAAIVAYLKSNQAATVAVSGYHDASGNADVNAEVSKDRAKAVRAVLVAAGVEETRVTLDKPQVSLGGNDADARRVEVTVHQ